MNRDEKDFGARFGPLALEGSAPKIFGESLVITPTHMQNFGPIGLAVLQIIRYQLKAH